MAPSVVGLDGAHDGTSGRMKKADNGWCPKCFEEFARHNYGEGHLTRQKRELKPLEWVDGKLTCPHCSQVGVEANG